LENCQINYIKFTHIVLSFLTIVLLWFPEILCLSTLLTVLSPTSPGSTLLPWSSTTRFYNLGGGGGSWERLNSNGPGLSVPIHILMIDFIHRIVVEENLKTRVKIIFNFIHSIKNFMISVKFPVKYLSNLGKLPFKIFNLQLIVKGTLEGSFKTIKGTKVWLELDTILVKTRKLFLPLKANILISYKLSLVKKVSIFFSSGFCCLRW